MREMSETTTSDDDHRPNNLISGWSARPAATAATAVSVSHVSAIILLTAHSFDRERLFEKQPAALTSACFGQAVPIARFRESGRRTVRNRSLFADAVATMAYG